MNRCDECIHFEICQALEENHNVSKINPRFCYFFKHKQSVVDLPCKIGDTVWVVNKTMGHIHKAKFGTDDISRIGKRVFMTEEDAKRYLRGGKKK